MMPADWPDEIAAGIVVCDVNGVIIYMNKQAVADFKSYGGRELIGKNVLDCHPPQAKQKLQELLTRQESNVYTIEKRGVKKIVYQAPWYREGAYSGLVEISFVLLPGMPDFVREDNNP